MTEYQIVKLYYTEGKTKLKRVEVEPLYLNREAAEVVRGQVVAALYRKTNQGVSPGQGYIEEHQAQFFSKDRLWKIDEVIIEARRVGEWVALDEAPF